MVGKHCPLLSDLAISCCHYTQEPGDRVRLESECTDSNRAPTARAPFSRLKRATFLLTSPLHLPIVKYPVYFALGLEELRLNQVYQPMEDSFIAALVTWSPLQCLRKFELKSGPHLTLMAANILIQACPNLQEVGRVTTWGGVEKEELESIQC